MLFKLNVVSGVFRFITATITSSSSFIRATKLLGSSKALSPGTRFQMNLEKTEDFSWFYHIFRFFLGLVNSHPKGTVTCFPFYSYPFHELCSQNFCREDSNTNLC